MAILEACWLPPTRGESLILVPLLVFSFPCIFATGRWLDLRNASRSISPSPTELRWKLGTQTWEELRGHTRRAFAGLLGKALGLFSLAGLATFGVTWLEKGGSPSSGDLTTLLEIIGSLSLGLVGLIAFMYRSSPFRQRVDADVELVASGDLLWVGDAPIYFATPLGMVSIRSNPSDGLSVTYSLGHYGRVLELRIPVTGDQAPQIRAWADGQRG